MEGLRKSDVEKALADTGTGDAPRRILEIRKSLSKSSTAKYTKFLDAKCSDDRIRGCLMFHGAGTGRWAGRLIQPQNFPRGNFGDVEPCINLFAGGDLDGVKLLYGDPMAAASTCIRPMIIPAAGKDFVCADYSSIEGRVLAWLAGEETALEVYRSGRDPYKVSASAIYNKRYEEIDKSERQIGKVAELALGYNGGKVAFQQMGITYGVHVGDDKAQEIVTKWRASRPMTTKLWKELERACMLAVQNPGKVYGYRAIRFKMDDRGALAMRLPSGRLLWYANARIEDRYKVWGDVLPTVIYDGVDPETRKWTDLELYGGLLTENAVQAISRDLLVSGMFAVEAAGYKIVFHVHDELVAEVPEDFGSVEEFEKLMCALPPWAEGLPIKAEGWRGKRYKK
jgi:DNA polymerase